MRIEYYIFLVLFLVLFVGSITAEADADSAQSREYTVKAAFLYNFIKFVEWPKENTPDSNEPITICILGKDPFGNAFEPVKDKQAKGRKVIVKRIKGFEELKKSSPKDKAELQRKIKAIKKCHVLFICSSGKEELKETINSVKNHSVLTVGETEVFFEAGGVINFLMEENKVRFEINLAAAKRAKLKISSNLLRLAKRVVKENEPQDTKK
jgi:hypothetical protein